MRTRAITGSRQLGALLLAAIVLLGLGATITPAAAQATTYMSCGWPPTYSSDPGLASEGQIHYAIHPSHCYWSDNGATYRLVNLVGLHWKNWGGYRAAARGKIVDNHDQDPNGFQRHVVRIVAFDPRPPVGYPDSSNHYYTVLRVVPFTRGSDPFVENLFRPGQGPVRLRLQEEATASRSECISVHTDLITGREVETTPGFGCSGARKVMKKYFRRVVETAQTPGGCAQKRFSSGCKVGKFRCHTTYYAGSGELLGACKGAKGRVRFAEFDRAPNA